MSTQMAAARRTLRSCALQVVPSTNVGTTDHGRHMRAAFWDVLRRAAMIAGFPYAVHFGRALRARPRYTNYETRARLYLCVHLDIVRHARRGQVDHKVETSAPTTYGPRQPPPRCIAAARGRGVGLHRSTSSFLSVALFPDPMTCPVNGDGRTSRRGRRWPRYRTADSHEMAQMASQWVAPA